MEQSNKNQIYLCIKNNTQYIPLFTINGNFNILESKGGTNINIYELLKNLDLNKIEKNKETEMNNKLNSKEDTNTFELEKRKKKKKYKAIDENFNQYLNQYFTTN